MSAAARPPAPSANTSLGPPHVAARAFPATPDGPPRTHARVRPSPAVWGRGREVTSGGEGLGVPAYHIPATVVTMVYAAISAIPIATAHPKRDIQAGCR